MTDKELIARLREIQGQAGLFASAAADRIEALLVEQEKDHANINLKADFIDNTINQLAETEAKLAVAVEALEFIDEDLEASEEARVLKARTTLAEIKGE